jgi:two-component system, chemotaxis family, chemotaxis protein CheY
MMKALLVVHSGTMRSVLRRILSMRGFEVAEADTSHVALDVLHSIGAADLVLLDWTLREVDTTQFVTHLRNETTHFTWIIMLHATEPGIRELHTVLLSGADDYLIKPFTLLQIDEKLAKASLAWQYG